MQFPQRWIQLNTLQICNFFLLIEEKGSKNGWVGERWNSIFSPEHLMFLFILVFNLSNLSYEFQGQQSVGNNKDSGINIPSGVHWYRSSTRFYSALMLKLCGLNESSHQPAGRSQAWAPTIHRNTYWKGYLSKEMIYELKLWVLQHHSLCQLLALSLKDCATAVYFKFTASDLSIIWFQSLFCSEAQEIFPNQFSMHLRFFL